MYRMLHLAWVVVLFFGFSLSVLAEEVDVFLGSFSKPEPEQPAQAMLPIRQPVVSPDSFKTNAEDLYEYTIGFNDLLEIEVFQVAELNRVTRVNSKGLISAPLIGAIKVGGLTVQQAEFLIEEKLSEKYLQNPDVTVFVKEYESQKITIHGEVNKEGVYPLTGKTTLIQAIAMAGGVNDMANESGITVFRAVEQGKVVRYTFDIDAIGERKGDGADADPYILKGDVIVVPKHGAKVFYKEIKSLFSFGNPMMY